MVWDDVAFHHLHVVNVVEQAGPRRIDRGYNFDAPSRRIALIIGVIDLAIEQFQDERDASRCGVRRQLLEQRK